MFYYFFFKWNLLFPKCTLQSRIYTIWAFIHVWSIKLLLRETVFCANSTQVSHSFLLASVCAVCVSKSELPLQFYSHVPWLIIFHPLQAAPPPLCAISLVEFVRLQELRRATLRLAWSITEITEKQRNWERLRFFFFLSTPRQFCFSKLFIYLFIFSCLSTRSSKSQLKNGQSLYLQLVREKKNSPLHRKYILKHQPPSILPRIKLLTFNINVLLFTRAVWVYIVKKVNVQGFTRFFVRG